MSDLISRQAAIDALYDWSEHSMTDAEAWHIRQVIGDIKSMPSAQLERKTGRWIDAVLPNDNGGLPVQVCDQCNTFFPLAYTGGGHRFCPSCGAKMDERKEE